jgi:hypothetical protein
MTTDHGHAPLDPLADDPLGRVYDHEILGQFLGAALEGCAPCQDDLLRRIADDAPTCARLVELACVATAGVFGGLPPTMYDDAAVGGLSSPEFRQLARTGLDGGNDAMFATCAAMSSEQRLAAANTAADTLIGQITMNAFGDN